MPVTTAPTTAPRPRAWRALVAPLVVVALAAAACGDDDTAATAADTAGDGTTAGAAAGDGDDGGSGDDGGTGDDGTGDGGAGPSGDGGAITMENLEEHCAELTDIVVDLRGEEPAEQRSASIPPGPSPVMVGDETGYMVAGCIYSYEEDSLRDQNRVWLTVEQPVPERADDPEVWSHMWDDLAVLEAVDGLGDAAAFHSMRSLDLRSVVHIRVGDTVVRVRSSAPPDMEGAPYLEQDALVAAGAELLSRLDV